MAQVDKELKAYVKLQQDQNNVTHPNLILLKDYGYQPYKKANGTVTQNKHYIVFSLAEFGKLMD